MRLTPCIFFVCGILYIGMANAEGDKKQVNARAVLCEKIEFAELNTMPAPELESVYCGYKLGDRVSEQASMKAKEQYKDDPQHAVLSAETRIRELRACGSPVVQISDLFKRKYPAFTVDCYKYQGFKESDNLQ